MLKKGIITLISGIVVGTFFIGCANSQPVEPKVEKVILQEEGVVENIKCLDKQCQQKELIVNLVQERVKVKITVKDNKKYYKGQIILIKVK